MFLLCFSPISGTSRLPAYRINLLSSRPDDIIYVIVFVHNSGLMENIRENDSVTFDIERGQKGLMAVNVKRK